MYGVSGNALSAADLTTHRFRTEQELPEKGQREYQPVNFWLENEHLRTALEERLQLIAEERVSRLGTLARAEWNEEIKEAIVTSVVGRHWQLFGHERKTRIWLYPEEALFLLECGCLELMHNGVPMSIQQAYCTLLSPNTSRTLNEYRTYAHLLRHGYRVLRHISPTKSVQPVSHARQKNEQVQSVLEVVDISESKPRLNRSSHSNADTSFNAGTHAKNRFPPSAKVTSSSQRNESSSEVSEIEFIDKKPVSALPAEEADVTLVYEQKGPVIQSCLKPKGSLVLFPDSQIDSQSSSRTVNVTPIDIDDNELEISYINKNVSVTLSPQKKERQNFPTPVKSLVAEVTSADTNKERSGSRLDVEIYPSVDEDLQCKKLEAVNDSHNVVNGAGTSLTANEKIIEGPEHSNIQVLISEENADYDETQKETLEESVQQKIPDSNSGMITNHLELLGSSSDNSSDVSVPEKKSVNNSHALTSQTIEVPTTNVSTLDKNHDILQETDASSDCELVAERKLFTTASVVSENRKKDVLPDDVLIVENSGNFNKSLVKSESDDVIEIEEISDSNSHIRRALQSPSVSGIKVINTISNKVENNWQQRRPKTEDDDIEIICDTAQQNLSRNAKVIENRTDIKQNAENNNFTNRSNNSAETSWKQSEHSVGIKPDVEIVALQDSSNSCGEHPSAHLETETRKRGHEDLDIKDECSSAKKPFLNINNWSQDCIETKPSTSQQINVINIEDDDARLTLAERKSVLDAIPSIENKFTIHVQAPKPELLPPNVKPKQKDYYIQLWRLKADGFGGGPAQNTVSRTNNLPLPQPFRQRPLGSADDGRINPWLPNAMFRPQFPPMMGFGNGLLPHPMFAQAILMAQSLAMAQSMAMNYSYRRPHRFYRGRYLHRPYFRRGYKRRYNDNNRGQPYSRNQGQSNNSHQFSRNSLNDDSSDTQSRASTRNSKIYDDKKTQIVIDIDDESNEKLGRKGDSDDDVIECFEVVPPVRGSSRKRHGRTRGSDNRYFAPSRKFRPFVEKIWNEEKSDIEEVPIASTAGRLASRFVKHEEVTLSSDEEHLDDSMSEQGLSDIYEFNTDVVPCLQPENCRNVDTILSRLQIFQQGKKPRNMVSVVSRKQLRISFDLYLPNMSFRKTTPGVPDYRIIVISQEQLVSHYEQSMPTLGDISWALKDFDDTVPLLLARVDPDSIQFTLFTRIDLPVAPGIACDVL